MLKLFTFISVITSIVFAEPTVLENDYYSVGWDNELRTTVWTKHSLISSEKEFSRKGNKYLTDERVNSYESKDYAKSGFDRGHLVPAGDLNFSKEALQSTFLMTNITPQKPEFNRGSWLSLEEKIRGWNETELKIVTGTLFDYEVKLANSKVPIPTAFYKILSCEKKGSIAFILPNKANHLPLEKYSADIEFIERVSGTKFVYPKMKKSNWFRNPLLFYINLLVFIVGAFCMTQKRVKR